RRAAAVRRRGPRWDADRARHRLRTGARPRALARRRPRQSVARSAGCRLRRAIRRQAIGRRRYLPARVVRERSRGMAAGDLRAGPRILFGLRQRRVGGAVVAAMTAGDWRLHLATTRRSIAGAYIFVTYSLSIRRAQKRGATDRIASFTVASQRCGTLA